jgi:hypothetical protein
MTDDGRAASTFHAFDQQEHKAHTSRGTIYRFGSTLVSNRVELIGKFNYPA